MRPSEAPLGRTDAADDPPHEAQLRKGFGELSFDAPLEGTFRAHYAAQNLHRQRIGLGLVALIYLTFLLGRMTIETAAPDHAVYAMRLLIVVAFLAVAVGSYTRLRRWLPMLMIGCYFVLAAGITTIEHIADPQGIPRHYEGMIFFTMHAYVFGGLVLRQTITAGLGIFFINLAGGMLVLSLGHDWQHRMFLLLPVNLLGAVALYQIEYAARKNFLQNHLLEREKRARVLAGERERILRDMHDGLGGTLVSTLSRLESDGESDSHAAHSLRRVLDDLRLLLYSLEPGDRTLRAELAMLRERLDTQAQDAGLDFAWTVDNLPTDLTLPDRGSLQLMRIIQEAFTNTVKHAHAHRFSVRLSGRRDDSVRLELADDGDGFDASAPEAGSVGLESMRARARRLGATLVIGADAHGTRICLDLPAPA